MSAAAIGQGAGFVEASKLLERERELAELTELARGAREGRGAVALVEGPAGIGKSRLLSAVADHARGAGFEVLQARGGELEHELGWGVVRELFAPCILGERAPPDLLDGAAALAKAVVAPAGERPDPEGSPRGWLAPDAAMHGLYWLTSNLTGRGPLALVVDDAHWADQPSLRWFAYLASRVEDLPVMLLLAARPEEGEASGRPLVEIAARARSVTPDPLSEAASAELLVRVFGERPDPEFARRCFGATGGNPFLLRELGLELRREGVHPAAGEAPRVKEAQPETIARAVLLRLSRMPAAASELARALAVLGSEASLAEAAALAGVDEDEAAAADSLAAMQILAPGLPLRFAHPIVRSVIYEEIPAAVRSRMHEAASRILAEAGAQDELVAIHLLETEPVGEPWAVDALRRAAAEAAAHGAPELAARILKRALREPRRAEDPELLFELGRAELAAPEPEALIHLEAASALAKQPFLRALALGTLGEARFAEGDPRGAFEAARAALDEMPTGGGGAAEAALVVAALAGGRMVPELVDEVRDVLAAPRVRDGEMTPAELARLTVSALDAFYLGGHRETSVLLRQVTERLRDPSVAETLPNYCLGIAGFVLAGIGEYDDCERVLDGIFERSRRRGSRLDTGGCYEVRAWLRWMRGDVLGALADTETALELTDHAWGVPGILSRVVKALTLLERGDPEGAEATLAPPGEGDRSPSARLESTRLLYGRASVAFYRRKWHEALTQALAAGERAVAMQAPGPYLPWRSLAARAGARLGDRDRALALAREELEISRRTRSRRPTGISLVTLGAIEGGDAGLEILHEAVGELERSGAELERARARAELGIALRRARRTRDARDPLREALDAARRIGATALAELALGELKATGARPRRERVTGIDALTPRELQIVQLAASGHSNVEIAQQLFVSLRTVETHLTHAYQKLEIDSRRELAAALRVGERAA